MVISKRVFSIAVLIYAVVVFPVSSWFSPVPLRGVLGVVLVIAATIGWGLRGGIVSATWSSLVVLLQGLFLPEMPWFAFWTGVIAYFFIGTVVGRALDIIRNQRAELKKAVGELEGTHAELRESEERYRSLVELSPDPIFVCSNERIVFANAKALGLFGVSEEKQLLGQPVCEKLYPPVRDSLHLLLEGSSPDKKIFFLERKLPRLDGSLVEVETSTREIAYAGRKSVLVLARDTTERRKGEREHARLAAIVESSADAIIGKDLEGTITEWNRGAERMYGYSPAEAIGKPIHLLTPRERRAEVTEILEKIRQGIATRGFETERQRKDGRRIPVLITVSPIRNGSGRIVGSSTIAQDLREKKKLELAIEKARADVLFAITHEMKSPLTNLGAIRELLQGLPEEERLKKYLEYEEVEKRNLQRLNRLLDNLLASQRTQATGLKLLPLPCSLSDLLQKAVKDEKPFADAQKIEIILQMEELPPMNLDQESIQKMIGNLLNNSIKYSAPGGEVVVRLKKREGNAILEFIDQGEGISQEAQTSLFQPFLRTESAIRSGISGTGLGLYVSRLVAEAHGGKIFLESEEGRGTRVEVTLPVQPVA